MAQAPYFDTMETSTGSPTEEPNMMHPVFLHSQLKHRQHGLLGLDRRPRPAVGDGHRGWWWRSRPSQPEDRPDAGRLVACGPAVAE